MANVEKCKSLNAFVSHNGKEEMEKEAAEADERYRKGEERSGLDGIPLTIKDNLYVKGL